MILNLTKASVSHICLYKWSTSTTSTTLAKEVFEKIGKTWYYNEFKGPVLLTRIEKLYFFLEKLSNQKISKSCAHGI